jgi:phosphatidylserine/phosphatidylglycerophosphate/cardiolipin synthase-like enzyme
MKEFEAIDRIIQDNWSIFAKPGVLTVRPGYRSMGASGWTTSEPAIVVSVDSTVSRQTFPPEVEGIAVDVREAGPSLKLRLRSPKAYNSLIAAGREEFAYPEFPYERNAETAKPLAAAGAELVAKAKPKIEYTPPSGVELGVVDERMTIICHASPDAGWPVLEKFLSDVKTSLTVGMYDFTSAHILQALESDLRGDQSLIMVLDDPALNPSADQSDQDTRISLKEDLKERLKVAQALVRNRREIARWIFPTAYHIKVAVKDGSSFWLSSGNWNNSNQPDIDPIAKPAGAEGTLKHSDRDWHVIVENEKLGKIYDAFLRHDFDVASQQQSGLKALVFNIQDIMPSIKEPDAPVPTMFFTPLVIQDKRVRIQPVLTPDNYCTEILALIKSAKERLYMQTQYIHPPKSQGEDDPFQKLIDAVIGLIDAGCDVRLITSQWQLASDGGWMEKLRMAGIDLSKVRVQNRVHNKGIVADSSVVALGSHNWSGDGVLRNRDATLIISDEEIARYYEGIFLHDWDNMARGPN